MSNQQPAFTFTVQRSKWLRGEGFEESRLLRPSDGKMCCLGFFGLACGLTPNQIRGASTPAGIKSIVPYKGPRKMWTHTVSQPDFLFSAGPDDDSSGSGFSDACAQLMGVNDDAEMSDKEREAKIVERFAKQGIQVDFVD